MSDVWMSSECMSSEIEAPRGQRSCVLTFPILAVRPLSLGSWLPLVQIGYGHQGAQPSWESLAGSSGITEIKEQTLA